jgi:7-alpha-hydroxysteroid dehydrogenase
VLVNNAGGSGPRAALETSERFFENALRMNVTQAFLLSKLCIPKMVETAGGGTIVNISSRSSDMVQTAFVAYGAGKAALNMMTRNLAVEVAPKVRVNAISVGGVETEGLAVVLTNHELREQFNRNTPMGRPAPSRTSPRRALPRVARERVGDGQDLPGRRRHRASVDCRCRLKPL